MKASTAWGMSLRSVLFTQLMMNEPTACAWKSAPELGRVLGGCERFVGSQIDNVALFRRSRAHELE